MTTSKMIEESAVIYRRNIWYFNQNEVVGWANRVIRSFSEQGDMMKRMEAAHILKEEQLTPNDFLDFIRRERLSDIEMSQPVDSSNKK